MGENASVDSTVSSADLGQTRLVTSPDADRWNARYAGAVRPTAIDPHELLSSPFGRVSPGMTVLDVASGWGDSGLHLAQQGATATFVDVSAVVLEAVEERAQELGLEVSTIAIDLSTAEVPAGPWDLITCFHYLDRDLLPRLVAALAPGGRLLCAIATVTNLERHERPSARFLLENGELASLVPEAEMVHFSEDWRANGVYEAWLVAEKPEGSNS